MARLTDRGFEARTLQQIISEIVGNLKATFGNSFDDSPESPDGQKIGIFAEQIWLAEQAAQAAYQSSDPDLALDSQLEYVCDYNGVYRELATPTIVVVQFQGTAGTVVPKGTLIGTEDGLEFLTDSTAPVGTDISAHCTENGANPVRVGEVNQVKSVVAGITSVSNASAGVTGKRRESDARLRNRRAFSAIAQGVNTVEAIYSDLLKAGASFVSIKANPKGVVVEGYPPHSFHTVVQGLEDDQVAQAIFNNMPLGINAWGSVSRTVKDSRGYPHAVAFSRPSDKLVNVEVKLKVTLGTLGDVKDNIEANLKDYINGSIQIGETVVWSDIFGAIVLAASVNGAQVSIREVKTGLDGGDMGMVDLAVAQEEKPVLGTLTVTEVK